MAVAQQYTISTVAGGAPIPTPQEATKASIGIATGVAVDSSGQVYFSGYGHSIYKIDLRGTLSRVAGNGRAGFSGDGGAAARAQLNSPNGISFDAAGNLYVADSGNHRIRKISTEGIISTVAGIGLEGQPTAEELAIETRLSSPSGVAIDSEGNLYIADSQNHRVRKVSATGQITTVAGIGTNGFSGDGGPADRSELAYPSVVAVDAKGSLYIVDSSNSRIRKVTRDGIVTTFAGTGVQGFSGDGGPADKARISYPTGLAVDATGNVFIADSNLGLIRRVATNGIITTVAGNGNRSAPLVSPTSLTVDAAGNLYAGDYGRINKIATSGMITTLAGDGTMGDSGDGGPASVAQLQYPNGVVADPSGNIFLVDFFNNRIRKIDRGGVITAFAGNGSWDSLGDGGSATAAGLRLSDPSGLAADGAGNVYIADRGNSRIRRVATDGIITTFAGNGTYGFSGDGGPADQAELHQPQGIAADSQGNLYIADSGNHRIRKVTPNRIITTIAGNGSEGFSGDDGPALEAQLSYPSALAVGPGGYVFFLDSSDSRVRLLTPDGLIYSIAGGGDQFHLHDGEYATKARLERTAGIALDSDGNLLISGAGTHRIRKVDGYGIITTVAGIGTLGYSGDGGIAACGSLNKPAGVAVDAVGNIYVADSGNDAIRILKPTGAPMAICGITNAASKRAGAIAPGELLVLKGSEIGPYDLFNARPDGQGQYPTDVFGTRVLFNDTPAPIVSAWATQLSVVVPYNLTGSTASVRVENFGLRSDLVVFPIAPAAPAIYTFDLSGSGAASARNEDGRLNSIRDPAKPGSVVSLFATGLGQTSPEGKDGVLNAAPLPVPLLPIQVRIGGQPVEVTYAGGAPGLIAGYMQVNVRIPANLPSGELPIVLTVGAASSPSGVTIAVSAAP